MRSLFNSVAILLATLVLWAIPAQGQIVSYKDDNGRRVFVNANPAVYAARPKRIVVPKGFKPTGIALNTTQTSFAESPEMSAAEQANRAKIEQMLSLIHI